MRPDPFTPGSEAVVLGSAVTGGGAVADPLDPARAVRRALAAGRHKAFEVTMLVVSTDLAEGADGLAFARRSLGPHGDRVTVMTVEDSRVMRALIGALEPRQLGIAVAREGATTRASLVRLSRS